MARKSRNDRDNRIYLREWREKKGLTQAAVAGRLEFLDDERLPTTAASLSRLENGKQPYSEPIINALAEIYGCEPWELLGRDPTKEGQVVYFEDYSLDEVEEARAIFEAIRERRRR